MPERRLLALSYAFPPMALPEAALIAKRLVNLPGWKTDVIAASPSRSVITDPDLVTYAEAALRSVTRLSQWPIPFHRLGLIGRVPDAMRFLNRKAVAAAHALGPLNFQAMLSWSQWHSIHLAASRLKTEYPALPWFAHFSDPWTDNPFSISTGIERRLNIYLERCVIEKADRLLFTSPESVELVMAKYSTKFRDKVRVIPHGFEPALYSGERPAAGRTRRKVLRYIGNFYGLRTPQTLFKALAAALQLKPSLADEITVEIIGTVEKTMDVSGGVVLPPGFVSFRPPVGYRESLRLMETADLLLVVDAPMDRSVFLPSKLIDYLGSGRPIVALSPEGASARVLRDLGELVADPADPTACATAILSRILHIGDAGVFGGDRQLYSAARTGAQLENVLNELVA